MEQQVNPQAADTAKKAADELMTKLRGGVGSTEAAAAAPAAEVKSPAQSTEFTPAEQRHLDQKIAEGKARAAAAREGANAARPVAPVTASPVIAEAPAAAPKPAPVQAAAAPAHAAPEAAAETAKPKVSIEEKLRGGTSKLDSRLGTAANDLNHTAIGRGAKYVFRKVAPFAVAYETYTTISEGKQQLADGKPEEAMKSAGRGIGTIGGVLASGGAGAALGSFGGPIGTAAGFLVGTGIGIVESEAFASAGEWVANKITPDKGDVMARSDALIKDIRTAVISETKAGDKATPEQHQAVKRAEEAYREFRKDGITGESVEQREGSIKQLHDLFVGVAKKEIAAVPVYEAAKQNYKELITAAVASGGMVTEEQQKAINDAAVVAFKARRQTAEGKVEHPKVTNDEVMKFGQQAIEQAEKSRPAGVAPAGQTPAGQEPATAQTAGAGAVTPGTTSPAPVPRAQTAATAPLALAPAAPPAPVAPPAAAPAKEEDNFLSKIPIIGGLFKGSNDPNKKSPWNAALGWIGDTKEGLSGMGKLAAGALIVAGISSLMGGGFMGLIVGLLAAVVLTPLISGLMTSFGGQSSSPQAEGVRAPTVPGPQQQKAQGAGQERQVVADNNSPAPRPTAAALDQATQRANLQPSGNISEAVVQNKPPVAPNPATPAGAPDKGQYLEA